MIRILIADDHPIIRDGLKQIISFVPEMQVVDEAGCGEEVLVAIRRLELDVIVLDMSMPGRSGIALIQQIKVMKPALPVLILSMHQESQYAVQAVRAGAAGYMTKNTASGKLVEGIRTVVAGGTFVSAAVLDKLIREPHAPEGQLPHTTLTPREFQIFTLLATGHGVNDIAHVLSLSNKTISTHKAAILRKMHVTSTAHLACYALKYGLIDA